MSDAREARRRRVSAADRVTAPARVKAAGVAEPVAAVEDVEPVDVAGAFAAEPVTGVHAAPTPRTRSKASVKSSDRVSAEDVAAKRAKAEAKQAAKDARRQKALSVLPARLGKKAAASADEAVEAPAFAEGSRSRRSVRTSVSAADRVDARAELEADARARARAEERERRRKDARKDAAARRVAWVSSLRARFEEKMQHPKFATATVFVAMLMVVGMFLYPTARTYYQAAREHDRLQAELTAVIQRNAKMAQKIDVLQTDEGIIQEAREQLGWVERGEYAVIVYGTGKEPEPDVDADIVSGTIKPPVTWYSPVLDIIFGVK